MDLGDRHTFQLFLEVYGTLPRAGPGSTAETLRGLSLVPNKGNIQRLLDLGCGPGAQTLVLAGALPEADVLALDLAPQMVAEARRRCDEAGLGDRVEVAEGDLTAPQVPAASQDLIWCEGAIYFAGIEAALSTWRPLLSAGGVVAFTEPIWIGRSPPEELAAWWNEEYPAISDEDGVRAAVSSAGFETIGFFGLAAASWWDEYYEPMETRVKKLLHEHPQDPVAVEIAAVATNEIEMFRRFSDFYTYGFFITRPDGEA
ncbi:MAG: class I SAM-dependent methyltransferase [Actinomycetia bacterium]|nr:class I SAM-dependent methyltransferase [Actinomycetes bacterium]